MLNEVPYEPEKPIPRVAPTTLARGFGAWLVGITGTTVAGYFSVRLWTDLAHPYIEDGPIIDINYGLLASVGLALTLAAFTAIISVLLIGYFSAWKRSRVDRWQRALLPVAWTFAAIAVVLPLGGGPLSSNAVANRGYLRCAALEFDGLFPERVFVQHPFLCVERDTLESRLALYNQLLQARREGRLTEALAAASLTVTQNGYIVPVGDEGRN